MTESTIPVVWSISGVDSSGGAGLAADQRAADAFGVHLCTVVAAVTAQNSRTVTHVAPVPEELLDAQLGTLSDDMPPRVVKTGLLGGAAAIRRVARWVDRLRERAPVALVVDPVLGASSGASFADDAAIEAWRDDLLPRATLATPNLVEARRLMPDGGHTAPELASALRRLGCQAVCVTGGDEPARDGLALDWFDGPHARGWLALPRVDSLNHHGTGCTFASAASSALALGFVSADAAVLAKMATTHALRHGHAAGAGPGPVRIRAGFESDPTLLPQMSFGDEPRFAAFTHADPSANAHGPIGLYAIVDGSERLAQVLAAGVRTVQLRIKTPARADARWRVALNDTVAQGVAACREVGTQLFVNDHWTVAHALGACGVHLGQEDLLALGEDGRAALAESGLQIGVSSHSLWELCRARSLSPRYIACGPVWATTTKAMPWRPQGLHNLAWWRHMAGAPVVAIGGVLAASQVREAARCGVDGVCIVRGLGDDPASVLPAMAAAWKAGRAAWTAPVTHLPTSSLGD